MIADGLFSGEKVCTDLGYPCCQLGSCVLPLPVNRLQAGWEGRDGNQPAIRHHALPSTPMSLGQHHGLGGGRPSGGIRHQFLPEDRYAPRCLDPQADLAAVDIDHGDDDVPSDTDFLAQLSTEDKHVAALLSARV